MARSLVVLFALSLVAASLAACGDTVTSPAVDPDSGGPRPPPLREPLRTPWGGAIMGLRVGLDASKKQFAQGEELVFTLRAENVLDTAYKLPHFADGAWCYKLMLQGSGGDNDYTATGPALDRSPANDRVLQPGETWSKEINLARGGAITKVKVGSVSSLEPGLYEVLGGYTNHKGEGYWKGGHCWTNVVTIEIK